MEQGQKQSKLGTALVRSMLLSMGLPMILSMVLQAFYNIVDSAFVSNMPQNGEAALNALTLAFPVQMLMIAISIGTGVGTNVLLSKSLGQNNREKANRVAGNAAFLGAVIFVVFLLFGLFGVDIYAHTLTQNTLILGMTKDYLGICCVYSFGCVFFGVYEKLLQATGRSLFSTIAQIAGALTNIVLDPIMIYGWLGCPELGVSGAAYATVIGQVVSAVVALVFHLIANKEISNKLRYFRPSIRIIGQIYAIGLPAIIAQALTSVMTYGMSLILGGISESAVTAYGLYYKVQQFVLMAAFGLRDAITPILSFNHGMGSKHRIRDGIQYGMLYTLIIMAIGLIVLEALAVPFSGIFGLSGETQGLFASAMWIISTSFLFAGANIAFQGIFQAVDSGIASLIISVLRQFLLVLPIAWGFAALVKHGVGSTWLVWLTFPIAEAVTAAVACFLLWRIYHKKIAILAE